MVSGVYMFTPSVLRGRDALMILNFYLPTWEKAGSANMSNQTMY